MSWTTASPLPSVIVGYGLAGRGLHHRMLHGLFGEDHPVVIVDPRPVLDPLPGGTWVATIANALAALRSVGVDPSEAVFHVVTEPSSHVACVDELVGLGARRIVVEKPLVTSMADAERMAQLGALATILPVSVWLASRVTAFVEELVAEGTIGRLRSLRMEQSKPRFRRTIRSASHGTAFDVELPHQMLLAFALAGPPEELLSAHTWPMALPGRSVPTMGGAVIESRHCSGVRSTLITDLTAPVRLRRLHLVGSTGEIIADYPVSADDDFGQVRVSGRPRRILVQDAPLSKFVEQAYAYFADRASPPRGDLAMHLRCAAMLEHASRSATDLPLADTEMIS